MANVRIVFEDHRLLEAAIVDGINVYLRDVLEPDGLLDWSGVDSEKEDALTKRKYEVAKRIATQCKEVYGQEYA